jgi:hypothetical protein
LLGGAADVTTLGVQDHRHLGRVSTHMRHQAFQLVFGPVGGKVGNLRLEGNCLVGGGIDDGGAKVKNFGGIAAPMQREFGRIRVQPYADQRLVAALGLGE